MRGRPKIGLVLSGGGARGVAHIGVLKALEELQVPIDYIAGTSMGAVVGGLYASGMSPDEIERWFAEADWRYLLSDAPPRASRPFRDKERDARLNQNLELAVSKSGAVQLPAGFISGQRVLLNLRELTLPVRQIDNFARLPIPFRAIATDLQTGEKVVLSRGSLAEAMRASMAVPGVFTPLEMDGRLLVDGGLSANLPIATVRAMGADIVIAVDVGPDLQKTAEELASPIAVANQMLDILIQRDTREQIRTLGARDIYVRLPLPGASSSDFAGSTKNIPPGYEGAMEKAGALRGLALSMGRYERYVSARRVPRETTLRISFLEYPGPDGPLRKDLETQIPFAPGDRIERWQLEKELGRIEGFHNSEIADFRVVEANGEYGLQVETRPKSRGPNFVNVGFDFNYTSAGETDANFLLALRLTELNRLGAEWETFLSIGDLTRVFSEWYQPVETARRVFLAANALYANEFINALDGRDLRIGFRLQSLLGGLDAGVQLGQIGELRVGYSGGASRIGRELNLPPDSTGWSERSELRAALTLDTLDRANFPTTGFFANAIARVSREELGARHNYSRLEAELYKPITFGQNTIVPRIVAGVNLTGDDLPLYDRSSLGGFLQLSGFSRRGLYDQNAGVAELIYYRELAKLPAAFGGGVYAGVSLEAGDVWRELNDFDFGHLKYGGSIFLGADTILGPLYLGVGGNSDSEVAVYLQLSPVLRSERRPR
ncbi:MAG: patatin-like phospholipase family protein [Chthoniobacterales bacterium]